MVLVIADSELEDVGKIRGWLLLPALGLILGFGRELIEVAGLVRLAVGDPSLEPILAVAIGVPWLAFVVIVGTFFFLKHRWAPWFYIAMLVGNVMLVGLSVLVILIVGGSMVEASGQLARSVVMGVIWIPYFLKSRRVKLTFVNHWTRRRKLAEG